MALESVNFWRFYYFFAYYLENEKSLIINVNWKNVQYINIYYWCIFRRNLLILLGVMVLESIIFWRCLAHLAEGHVSYCHHLAPVVIVVNNFSKLFSSETTGPIETKLGMNVPLGWITWSPLLKIEHMGQTGGFKCSAWWDL